MTIEHRTFISPDDISGVELECPVCHAKHLTWVEKFSRVIRQCPNCQQAVISDKHFPDSSKRSDEEALAIFVEALKDIQERMENSGKDRLLLRLQVAGLQGEQ